MADKNEIRQLATGYAEKYGIPTQVFSNMIRQESGFNPGAVSSAGAQGLGQLMPGTARALGVKDPFDPNQNLDGSARYLKQQFDRFGSWDLALAAYNAGPAAVNKYKGIPPFEETQNYVKSIMGRKGEDVSPSTDTASTSPTNTAPGKLDPLLSQFVSPTPQGSSQQPPTQDGRAAGTAAPEKTTETMDPLLSEILGSPLARATGARRLQSLPEQISKALLPEGPKLSTPSALETSLPAGSSETPPAPSTPTPPSTSPSQPNPLAYSLGLTPQQIALGTTPSSPSLSAPAPLASVAALAGDPISQQATRIAQTATGPLAQAINDYAQKTGGRNYVKDLVIRYAAAPPQARTAVLQEAATYGLAGLVQSLGSVYGGPATPSSTFSSTPQVGGTFNPLLG